MLATVTLFTATEPCALPDGYSDFTLIVRDAAAIAAKNVYTAIAGAATTAVDDVERKMVRVECEAADTTPARTCLYREGSEPRMPCCTTCKGGSCPGEGGVAAQ